MYLEFQSYNDMFEFFYEVMSTETSVNNLLQLTT